MRARRLVAVAAVAALGVLSLGACGKSAPDVAAYVGDTTYQVNRVDAIYDEASARYAESVRAAAEQTGATPTEEQLRWRADRQDVVNLLVGLDLGRRLVAEKQIEVPDRITEQDLGRGLGVPDTEYARLAAEWYDIFQALETSLPPAELTDDAQQAVYEALLDEEVVPAGWSIEEIRRQFGDAGFVRQVSAIGAALRDEAEKADVSVNPRYGPVGVPALVQGSRGYVQYSLPYLDEDGRVIDISTPEPLPAVEPTGAEATEPVTS